MKTIQVAGPLAKRVNVAEFGIVTKQEFMERAKEIGRASCRERVCQYV